MATERIDIQITETGARRVKRSIEDIGQGASGAERALTLLKRALGGLGLAAAVRSILQTADAYTNMQNQLKLVTTGTMNLAVVTDELFGIAQRTRGSLEGTADVYTKVARQASALGLSQREVLTFTESLNQAIALSGSTAQQAEAGIRQLGQAIGSGALRGDELNSILENTGEVAKVIADGMGVTIGQLRKLGAEGKITGQAIVEAFNKAQESLNERFAKTVPTISQAIQVLSNAWTMFIGRLDTSTGVTAAIAQGIMWVAENMETLARVAGVVGTTILTVLVARAIPALLASLARLTAFIAANPFGAIAVAITAASSALVFFSDQISISEDGMVKLADAGVYAWTLIKKGLSSLYEFLADVFKDFVVWANETFGLMIEAGLSFPRAIARALDDLWKGVSGFFTGLSAVVQQAKENLSGYTGVSLGQAFMEGFNKGVMGVGDKGPVEGALDSFLNGARMVANSRIEREAAEAAARRKAMEDLEQDQAATVTVPTEKGPTFSELLKNLRQEGQLLRVNNDERMRLATVLQFEEQLKRGLDSTEEALVRKTVQMNHALGLRAEALENLGAPSRDFLEQSKALNDLMAQSPALTEMATQALAELEIQFLSMQQGGSFADGYVRQLRIMQLETRNAMADMGAEIASIFGPGGMMVKGVGDAVATSIVNFKEYRSQMEEAFRDSEGNLTRHFTFWDVLAQKIKDVAKGIIEQVISALVQMAINMAINAALGKTLATTATAASIAQAAAIGTAWATPAALVNAATFGAGAAAGTTALATSVATAKGLTLLTGFAEGGYTGDGGRQSIAGVVHGQEYVMNANATRRIGRNNLDRMASGYGMFGQMPSLNVTVVNRDIPGAEFQVNQLGPDDVEIIARRIVTAEAPNVIAADMNNPSGRTRRAIIGNTTAQNKR
jgi:tape measure domain-containing protein